MNLLAEVIAGVVVLLGIVAFVLLWSFLWSFPVYWLWNNCLLEAVSGVHYVSWLQAWGITILCSFLFKTVITQKKDKE